MSKAPAEPHRARMKQAPQPALNKTPVRSAILSLGLAVYFLCLAAPQVVLTSFWMTFSPQVQATIRTWQIVGVATLLVWALAMSLARVTRGSINWRSVAIWSALTLWMAASTVWSINPRDTLLYTGVFVAVMVSCAVVWLIPDTMFRRATFLAMAATLAGVAYLFARLPMGPRTVGGVGSNLLAHFALAIIMLGYLAGTRPRAVALVAGLALIAFAQGRTVLIGTATFGIFYYLIASRIRDQQSLLVAMGVTALSGMLIVIFAHSVSEMLTNFSSSLLGITDEARLAGSGFSGRSRSWGEGFSLLQGHELTGYGFRTRTSLDIALAGYGLNSHSGLLNSALDLGVVGLVLFVLAYGASIWFALSRWATLKADRDRVAASFLIGMIPILGVEPNYLNFASPSHFLMAFCLAGALVSRTPAAQAIATVRAAPSRAPNKTQHRIPVRPIIR